MADKAIAAPRRSWWSRLRADLGRRIEQRGLVIWYLIVERGVRGLAVLGLGLYLFTVSQDHIASSVESIEARYGLATGSGSLIQQVAAYLLNQVGHL